jgi:hypothetical protein
VDALFLIHKRVLKCETVFLEACPWLNGLLDDVFVQNFFHALRCVLHGGDVFQNFGYSWQRAMSVRLTKPIMWFFSKTGSVFVFFLNITLIASSKLVLGEMTSSGVDMTSATFAFWRFFLFNDYAF